MDCIFGEAGLTKQRNRGLTRVQDSFDVVVFFDDDFAPAADWLELCARIFESEPGIVGVTGAVLRDGAQSEQLSWEDAERVLDEARPAPPAHALIERTDLYGCNMAYRLSAVAGRERFDERLILYGWLEDADFSRAMARRGRLVEYKSMAGVHLGLKGGRVSGRKYGYSQVANAWYLYGKRSMSLEEAWRHTFKALAANGLRQFRSEPYIDRRGRFVGNLIGLCHLASRNCRPERAAEL